MACVASVIFLLGGADIICGTLGLLGLGPWGMEWPAL